MLVGQHANTCALLTSAAVALAIAGPAAAQADQAKPDARTAPSQLEEVTVTAQKRAENVQNVPIAITAIQGAALASRDLSNVTQIAGQTPNVTINNTSPFGGSSQMFAAYIRGVGQNDFAFNVEPGVGLYVDGVYYARMVGAAVGLLDVDHIEVLKGPQGTLFGRNTIGGAVSIQTKDPGRDFAYRVEFTGGSLNRTDISGVVDLPLVQDKLYAQLAFASLHRDGYERRIPYPGPHNFVTETGAFGAPFPPGGDDRQGNVNTRQARLKLLFTPSEDLRVTLSADFTRSDEEGMPFTIIKADGNVPGSLGQLYNTCISLPVSVLNSFGLSAVCGPRAEVGTPLAGVNVDGDPLNDHLPFGPQAITGNIDTTYSQGNNTSRVHPWGLSATEDWRISPNFSVKSITAYRQLSSRFGGDQGGTPFNWVQAGFKINQHQFSQEVQLNAHAFDDHLKSVFGAFYFHEHGIHVDYVPIAAGLINIQDPAGDPTFDNKSWALFTHNNFALTDQLSLTFGLRYTIEHKWFEGFQADVNQFFVKLGTPLSAFPDPNDLSRLYPVGRFRQNTTNTSVRAGAEYKVAPTVMTYVSFSQGYRSGGWTTRLTAPPTDPLVAPSFAPETANTYEAGIKSELFDRRLRLNLAAFHTDYDNIQLTVQVGNSPVTQNGGTARIQGFEIESEARPIENLTLSGSLGYLDAKYTKLAPGVTISLADHLIDAPKWSFSLGGAYRVPLASGGAVSLRVDYDYKGTTDKDALNAPELRQPGYGLLDSSVTYISPSGRWEVQAGVHNITDTRYLLSGVNDFQGVGFIGGSYSPPRQWFATLRFRN